MEQSPRRLLSPALAWSFWTGPAPAPALLFLPVPLLQGATQLFWLRLFLQSLGAISCSSSCCKRML